MKTNIIVLGIVLGLLANCKVMAQNWVNGGNSLSATGRIGTNNGHSFAFETNNTERGRISSSGLWGIGTSSPSARLHVNTSNFLIAKFSNSATTGDRTAVVDFQNGHGHTWSLGVGGSSNGLNLTSGQFYIERVGLGAVLTADRSGNVSIGTNSPGGNKLKVSHGTSGGFAIEHAPSQHNWQFFTMEHGWLDLLSDGVTKGTFSFNDGTYFQVSDRRLKTNVQAIPSVLQKINQLKPSSYQYLETASASDGRSLMSKPDPSLASNSLKYGFIAQEVKEVFPMLVHNHMDKSRNIDLYTVDYSGFGVIAIRGIQELQQVIATQQQTINTLEARLAKLEGLLNAVNGNNSHSEMSGLRLGTDSQAITDISLEQNYPNPFDQTTTIRYKIPAEAKAQLMVYDATAGRLVKSMQAPADGKVVLKTSDLKSGTYIYTLVVNGQAIASKIMVLTK